MFMDVEGEIVDGYSVPNADNRERGPVRVRDALKYSLNIPVAKRSSSSAAKPCRPLASGWDWYGIRGMGTRSPSPR
jgi:hypothetical protein